MTTDDGGGAFGVTAATLLDLHPRNMPLLVELGGPDGLARALRTDLAAGLGVDADTTARVAAFADNRLPDRKSKSFARLMWEAYTDKILVLLTSAALVSLAIGAYQSTRPAGEPDWIEGVAIVAAIAIVVLVTAGNDWQKERQFAKLNRMKDDRLVSVVRSGGPRSVSTFDVLVGDVLLLEQGDILPVDGLLVAGHRVACDQSSVTGESDLVRKQTAAVACAAQADEKRRDAVDPFLLSGAKVNEGLGRLLVTATGVNSTYGKTLMSVTQDGEQTPLQKKLFALARWIAYAGMTAAGIYFLTTFVEFLVAITKGAKRDDKPADKGQLFLDLFVVSVSIIVVAVPEGLPLAVTMALAFATTKMLKDKNLVRLLRSCETMGNATTVCSDKTGTLTQNNMTVVAARIRTADNGVQSFLPRSTTTTDAMTDVEDVATFSSRLGGNDRLLLRQSIICNTTAQEHKAGPSGGNSTYVGSKTETALLSFAASVLGVSDLAVDRSNAGETMWVTPFDSNKKVSAAVIRLPGSESTYRVLLKGAPEIVLDRHCGETRESQHSQRVRETIVEFASRSWRTIGMAYKDLHDWPPDGRDSDDVGVEDICHGMTWVGVFGLQDPVRPGVPEAVASFKRAGVVVRMVTGDNEHTARAIARECGILTDDGLVVLGPEFRRLGDDDADAAAAKLQVLARSSPEDKRRLVQRLKALGETVAVTGDGSNDAPALKAADVGFAMGLAGTEMAKEASAIILMDDDFSSIVSALMWGRAVNDAVKRFLQFQLTVNITAVLTTMVTGMGSANTRVVLPAIQLLWVNLIMDTLAALALATDPPARAVLDRRPERKDAPLITVTMWKMILGQAAYQLLAVLLVFFAQDQLLVGWTDESQVTTLFNAYVWMQIFNTLNSRRLDNRLNVLEGVTRNWIFAAVVALMAGVQTLIVFKGGKAIKVVPLTAAQWGVSLLLGSVSLPLGALIRLVPDGWLERSAAGVCRWAAKAKWWGSSSSSSSSRGGGAGGKSKGTESLV